MVFVEMIKQSYEREMLLDSVCLRILAEHPVNFYFVCGIFFGFLLDYIDCCRNMFGGSDVKIWTKQ
ncbi:hypothetical protein WI38_31720 [Burkholderia ubonensis]|uniref:Uncharacterized protein n=1 Tax=Burkholderia ubonensis TaxID=101571 RepID=A0A102KUY7_9BURK|nr:hypothetical protein WI35_26140 [Burkholderia ubonensis]KUZ81989.1 hypothetical protein WI38_31720 [Burkholderia ubonensis]KVA00587.1 hypothetical protein WI39_04650 [Burkholderia ubonensis]